MANKYCNLNGYNKVSDEYSLITTGFDGVDTDVTALQTEVREIVKGDANAEVGQAHISNAKDKVFPTIKDRFEEIEVDVLAVEEKVAAIESDVSANVLNATLSLSNTDSIKSITAKVADVPKVEVEGNMLVNLLGNDGDCEDVSKWNIPVGATITIDSINKVFNSNSIKVTDTTSNTEHFTEGIKYQISSSKYYLVSGYVKPSISNVIGRIRLVMMTDSTLSRSITTPIANQDISKFNRIGVTFQASATENNFRPRFQLIKDSLDIYVGAGESCNFDGVMINEITADEYNNLTVDQLMAKYPYVNSIQPTLNPCVTVRGKNLFDGTLVIGQYDGTTGSVIAAADRIRNANIISVKPNTNYVLSNISGLLEFEYGAVYFYDYCKKFISVKYNLPNGGFITPENCGFINFRYASTTNINAGIQLEEGTVATSYEPYRETQRIYPCSLGKVSAYADKLVDDGVVAKKIGKVKKVILNGSLYWGFVTDYNGFKRITCSLNNGIDSSNLFCIKYNGKALINGATTTLPDSVGYASDKFYITVADVDSGFGETYVPTVDEIKAYFNGWKMYLEGSDRFSLYNGTGNKRWCKITRLNDTNALYMTADDSSVLPTTFAGTDTFGNAYTPYQLWYALATPVEEIIEVRGSLGLEEGYNCVDISSEQNNAENSNSQQISAVVEYADNLRVSHNELVEVVTKQEDEINDLLYDLYYEKLAREAHSAETATQANLGHVKLPEALKMCTLQNGWLHGDTPSQLQYCKNDFGIVHIAGQIEAGVLTTGTIITTLGAGYKPRVSTTIYGYKPSDGSMAYFILSSNGNLITSAGLTTGGYRINGLFLAYS